MNLRTKSFLLAALLALAPLAAASDARVDRLTDLLVRAIPMGQVFESLALEDPNWPVQERPGAVSAGQLKCLRRELSSTGYRRAKREDVADYADRHGDRLAGDIRVLDEGAAFLMGELMLAGVEQERTGQPVDEAELIGRATPAQQEAFMEFMTAEQYAPLRSLAGIGNAFDAADSAEQNEANGEAAGADLATRIMLRAMDACDVPTSLLFE